MCGGHKLIFIFVGMETIKNEEKSMSGAFLKRKQLIFIHKYNLTAFIVKYKNYTAAFIWIEIISDIGGGQREAGVEEACR